MLGLQKLALVATLFTSKILIEANILGTLFNGAVLIEDNIFSHIVNQCLAYWS